MREKGQKFVYKMSAREMTALGTLAVMARLKFDELMTALLTRPQSLSTDDKALLGLLNHMDGLDELNEKIGYDAEEALYMLHRDAEDGKCPMGDKMCPIPVGKDFPEDFKL
jgi:hypothetical protein